MKNIPEKYSNAILGKHPNAKNIRRPEMTGSQNNVFFADINNKTFAFKFNAPEQIRKNVHVCNIYKAHHIPCPDIRFGEHDGVFFEEYELLAGTSLFEAIKNGMPKDKIQQVYREILECIKKMESIAMPQTLCLHNIYAHQFAKEHTTNVNNASLGQICMALIYVLNMGAERDTALYHSDITPKNTIVSSDGHLVGFVDLDSVVISNINYVFGMMCAKYIQLGYDMNELIAEYKKIGGKKLNYGRVRAIANATNFGKSMLWKHAQQKQK